MTQKRKAELQRKLSMAPVAKPPSDLAGRIKAEIPEYLDTKHDRERLSRSLGFSLRIAASIILVVTSAFLAVDIMSRGEDVAVAPPPVTTPAPQQVAEAVPVESRDELLQVDLKDARRQEKKAPEPQRMVARTGAKETFAAPLPVPAAAPPPAAEALTAEVDAPAAGADSAVMSRVAEPEFGYRSRMDAAEKSVSVGNRVKTMLQKGEAPASADVRALVDHFAGPPPAALGEVRLEVEASRAPVSETGAAVIRYTIDMPVTEGSKRAVTPVKVSIALEKAVVESYRTISDARPLGDVGAMLIDGQSATGLMEVKLAGDVPDDQRIATIVFEYGGGQKAARPVFARDLDRNWDASSRRHRLATLSAAWGESLSGSRRAQDVAQAAAALAEEAPGDERAQELAALTASSRRRSSSPTGSGR